MRFFQRLVLLMIAIMAFSSQTLDTTSAKSEERNVPFSELKSKWEELNMLIASGSIQLYGKARTYTPVFYKEDFSRYFGGGTSGTLILDEWNEIDPVETIVPPTSIFQIQKIIQTRANTVLQVTTKEYPYDGDPHYIDTRFVQVFESLNQPEERNIHLPRSFTIIKRLREQVGKQYVWWGSPPNGARALARYFPSKIEMDAAMQAKWILDGFDCSGILHWATNGYTPRNTSKLVYFGTWLEIASKTKEEIAKMLKPLDIIVWRGHDLIVIDKNQVIESTANFTSTGNYSTPNGVRIRSIDEALTNVMEEKWRVPANNWDDPVPEGKKAFVIRRWQ